MTLVEFLTARLDEDEQWALSASAPYQYAVGNPPVPDGGVHWTWVVGENWTPVTPDPVTDEFLSIGDDWSCNLATVEQWQSVNGKWMMRRTYAGTIQEMDPSAAGHIARHDPARVLREVEAKRRIITNEQDRVLEEGPLPERMRDGIETDVMALLALPYADHPDYQEAWRV
jgi:hypothetical protein